MLNRPNIPKSGRSYCTDHTRRDHPFARAKFAGKTPSRTRRLWLPTCRSCDGHWENANGLPTRATSISRRPPRPPPVSLIGSARVGSARFFRRSARWPPSNWIRSGVIDGGTPPKERAEVAVLRFFFWLRRGGFKKIVEFIRQHVVFRWGIFLPQFYLKNWFGEEAI